MFCLAAFLRAKADIFRMNETAAAGDSFLGGLAIALGEGQPIAEAIRWGNAAGALATTKLGAQTSIPNKAALLNLLKENS